VLLPRTLMLFATVNSNVANLTAAAAWERHGCCANIQLGPALLCQIGLGWPRPPAARISFLLPRTSRGKAAPSALSSATRVGSRNPTRQSRYGRALPLRGSRESEVAANETRAAGGRACPWARRVGARGPVVGCKPSPCQISPLQHSVHRPRSDRVVPDRWSFAVRGARARPLSQQTG
jgi:hypothetical protein